MFGWLRMPHAAHHHSSGKGILGAGLIALLLAAILLLLVPPHARGNFVYWANGGQSSIGRAKINGSGPNNALVAGLTNVHGVTVDSKFIYWTQGTGATSTIGRANLDGSGANPSFIPNSSALNFAPAAPQADISVTPSAIYWVNTGTGTIGRANLDGGSPNGSIVNPGGDPICGIAADQSFIYWMDVGLGQTIGRAGPTGSGPTFNFVPAVTGTCGLAVDPSFLYWGATGNAIGRAPIAGGVGSANNVFIPSATTAPNTTCGVAVNSQYIFWGNVGGADQVGRANIGGGSPNPGLFSGPTGACLLMSAAPSNKVTINSITKKKKKGTATINAKVPGPGQVTLSQTAGSQDVNATAAAIKQQGLTLTAASSFKLAVKPTGKTAKKLKKKGKLAIKVFVNFVPNGVAGVPNSKSVKITLIKKRKNKKK